MELDHVIALQRLASDPKSCVWVSASAGTGKTKVLVDRLLRLLLEGNDPAKILCLTFTKAAASEMIERLQHRLEKWAIFPEALLIDDLTQLTGSPPFPATLKQAASLYEAIYLKGSTLKIQTIHGFCQFLLRRFPLEAGICPNFTVLDEQESFVLRQQSLQALYGMLYNTPTSDLQDALRYLIERTDLLSFEHLLQESLQLNFCPQDFQTLLQDLGIDEQMLDLLPDNQQHQDLALDQTFYRSLTQIHSYWIDLLAKGNSAEQRLSIYLKNGQSNLEDLRNQAEVYKNFFLTQQGTRRKKLLSADLKRKYPDIEQWVNTQADHLENYLSQKFLQALGRSTKALGLLIQWINQTYNESKNGRLDYQDLLKYTQKLLYNDSHNQWVLYKLDGGVHHILIDEAQDISPEQWEIIVALTQDFFSGESLPVQRSLFVVGDYKQSIYSFQGADPTCFLQMADYFAKKVTDIQKKWQFLSMTLSFRSSDALIQKIDQVFEHPSARKGVLQKPDLKHSAVRQAPGMIDIWPLVQGDHLPEMNQWQLPAEQYILQTADMYLAEKIAQQVKTWWQSRYWLPSLQRPFEPHDAMILVRRRTAFIEAVIKAFKRHEIPITGLDRFHLLDQLGIQDLLALAAFIIRPQDDLALACVLKSPLIGLEEEALYQLCYNRAPQTLWERLTSFTSSTEDHFANAHSHLEQWIQLGNTMPPYDFFFSILTDYKTNFLKRLGPGVIDTLEEFLLLVLKFEKTEPLSLYHFLEWIQTNGTEVNRESHQPGQTLIFTVHGAKGLQAPVVFLCDTTRCPKAQSQILQIQYQSQTIPLYSTNGWDKHPFTQAQYEYRKAKIQEEYNRLLYVGLTRAQDHIVVCGTGEKAESGSWYDTIQAALGDDKNNDISVL